jgi:serine/threonine protein kinase
MVLISPKIYWSFFHLKKLRDIIRESLRAEVRHELEYEYDDRISSAEEEASDWESRADSYECVRLILPER